MRTQFIPPYVSHAVWVAAPLAATGIPVILKALANVPVQFDRLDTRDDNAAMLQPPAFAW